MPRGVLLAGPPGTGRPCWRGPSRARPGVPFFSASASEFIEMIVGVGASRVRELFAEARKVAPVDHLHRRDRHHRAGPRRRRVGMGGHDEREQTLNQILTEMDGFSGSEGVIVIAATNRADILDPALTRPGRFDRVVNGLPAGPRRPRGDPARSTPARSRSPTDVDLDQVARTTPGMTGADLANLANEAALLAVKRKQEQVTQSDLSEALEKVQLGAERHARDAGGGAPPHRLPRERARPPRHAAARAPTRSARSPSCRAAGRSASPCPPRTPTGTRYTRGVPARPHHRRAGRHGGRAGRLRRHHHRRRERPRTGHQHRPRHGRAAGA